MEMLPLHGNAEPEYVAISVVGDLDDQIAPIFLFDELKFYSSHTHPNNDRTHRTRTET